MQIDAAISGVSVVTFLGGVVRTSQERGRAEVAGIPQRRSKPF